MFCKVNSNINFDLLSMYYSTVYSGEIVIRGAQQYLWKDRLKLSIHNISIPLYFWCSLNTSKSFHCDISLYSLQFRCTCSLMTQSLMNGYLIIINLLTNIWLLAIELLSEVGNEGRLPRLPYLTLGIILPHWWRLVSKLQWQAIRRSSLLG